MRTQVRRLLDGDDPRRPRHPAVARRRRLRRRLILAVLGALLLAPLFLRIGADSQAPVGREPSIAETPAALPEYGDRLVLQSPEPSEEPKLPPPPAALPAEPEPAPALALPAPEAGEAGTPPEVVGETQPLPEAPADADDPQPSQTAGMEEEPPLQPAETPGAAAGAPVEDGPVAIETVVPAPRPIEAIAQAPVPSGPTEVPVEAPSAPAIADDASRALALAAPDPPELAVRSAPVVEPPGPRPRLPTDVPAAMRAGSGFIALIIDDVGPAPSWSRRALALPGPLTMAFLPYAEDLDTLTASARDRGHEIFLHMPMQPVGHENPGPNALLYGMDEATLRQRLAWAIDRVDGAVGMNNHMGSRLTAEPEAMTTVMDVLRAHDLAFVDSRTSPRSVADRAAERAGIAHVGRDVFLDHFPGTAFVRRQLAEVERQARTNGSVVAIGHPLPATLEVLESWIPQAKARGFRFVPVSRIIADRTCSTTRRPGCPTDVTRLAAKAPSR